MALDVGVHDGLEVLELAVLQEVDDVDLPSVKHKLQSSQLEALLSGV